VYYNAISFGGGNTLVEIERGSVAEAKAWPSFIINLDAAAGRWTSVNRQFERLGIVHERIRAVAPADLARTDLSAVYDEKRNRIVAKRELAREEIGCYLSHIQAWRRIVDSGASGGFVFEDDFISDPALPDIMTSLASGPGDWDIVKLYGPARISGKRLRALTKGFDLLSTGAVPAHCLGYAITASAAARLSVSSLPFARPVDLDHKHWWEQRLTIRLVSPSPLQRDTQHLATSGIEAGRRSKHAPLPAPLRLVRNLRYQLRYRIALAYHTVLARDGVAAAESVSPSAAQHRQAA